MYLCAALALLMRALSAGSESACRKEPLQPGAAASCCSPPALTHSHTQSSCRCSSATSSAIQVAKGKESAPALRCNTHRPTRPATRQSRSTLCRRRGAAPKDGCARVGALIVSRLCSGCSARNGARPLLSQKYCNNAIVLLCYNAPWLCKPIALLRWLTPEKKLKVHGLPGL